MFCIITGETTAEGTVSSPTTFDIAETTTDIQTSTLLLSTQTAETPETSTRQLEALTEVTTLDKTSAFTSTSVSNGMTGSQTTGLPTTVSLCEDVKMPTTTQEVEELLNNKEIVERLRIISCLSSADLPPRVTFQLVINASCF